MGRKYIDCRDHPGSNCTVAIAANNEDELMEAIIQHAVTHHGYEDTAEVRDALRKSMKDGSPPA